MTASRSRSLLAGLALVLAGSSSAFAVDGQAFADRLKAVMADQSTTLAYTGVSTDDDDVVLKGAQVTPKGEGAQPVSLGDIRFETVTGSTPDGWRVARVQLADVDQSEDGTRVTLSGIAAEGIQIKGTNDKAAALSPIFFDRAQINNVAVERQGKTVATVENGRVENLPTAGGGYRANFGIGRFLLDATAASDGPDPSPLVALGYPQLTGDLTGSGAWDPATGALTLDPLQLEVDNAGALSFSYTITGYTPSFIQSLAQLSDQMKASQGASDGTGMAVIGLISQLYLRSAELSFTDRSLTGKLLDYYSAQNKQTRPELVDQLVSALPLALAYLQNPEFQAQVTAAVRDFLQNPRTLNISIAPQNPIPATQILGAAMGAPQTLPQVLNLSVRSGN
ncbi:hypothetical protein [Aureimonas sp. AU40]|uniref:hypothetical protein n=1 Tax=Aureimonas sp. AU40 TaxID=1637747 RepID=UPI000783AAD0|nr:hypothetical protein [Aureimonas sp. AU40]